MEGSAVPGARESSRRLSPAWGAAADHSCRLSGGRGVGGGGRVRRAGAWAGRGGLAAGAQPSGLAALCWLPSHAGRVELLGKDKCGTSIASQSVAWIDSRWYLDVLSRNV